ncbi:interaptin-like [Centruroides vittatus]|uniref:interaptin-like n=1 Tax=Centruroides vittatus TaxID=120091 RepID=UPI003510693A
MEYKYVSTAFEETEILYFLCLGMEKRNLESQAIQSQLEKELNELQSKHSQLLNDYKLLKEKNTQVESKLSEIKQDYSIIEEEKKNLNFEVSNHLETLRQKTDEVNKLHDHLKKILSEKEQLYHENSQLTWKMNQFDSKLMICEKQHRQLMLQFDEVSLHLNNCINMKNFTSQEKLILKEKLHIDSPHEKSVLKFDHNDSNSNEKLVHIPDMKVSHPSEIIESSKNIEETVIGNEFNETLNMNTSVPFTDLNGGNRQLDVPITETTLKEKLNTSLKNTSLNITESTVSKLVSIQHDNTSPALNNQTEKTVNQLPLPLPHIINNNKVKTDNTTINSTKSSNDTHSIKVLNYIESDLYKKHKNVEKIPLNKSSLVNSNITSDQTITLESPLDQRNNIIKLDNLIINRVPNIRHSSFEMNEQPEYVKPDLQNNKDIQFQREAPFDNEINASRMDGDYNQDQQIDNMRADYDNDRNINNIPERSDY